MSVDLVQKYGGIYVKTAPAVLGKLHDTLMSSLSSHKPEKSKDVLVIGPSQWVLPYSYHPGAVSNIVGDGSLTLMDYNDDMLGGADEFLNKIGYMNDSNLSLDSTVRSGIDISSLEERTIALVKANARDPLPFPDNSFDCIDATLCIHHVIPYLFNLDSVTSELNRILKPGGMLHYGTGNVDMDSESRIVKHAGIAKERTGKEVGIRDLREQGKGYIVTGSVDGLRIKPDDLNSYDVVLNIDADGIVSYDSSTLSNQFGSTPLIVPESDSEFINQIHSFYQSIFNLTLTGGHNEETLGEYKTALDFEESNARKGVVEYYQKFNRLQRALEKAGFENITRTIHKNNPFYNITALKRG